MKPWQFGYVTPTYKLLGSGTKTTGLVLKGKKTVVWVKVSTFLLFVEHSYIV